jgi:NADH:ubiquinone oxidoreductase subunit C
MTNIIEDDTEIEIDSLHDVIHPAISGMFLSGHLNNNDKCLNILTYRQTTLPIATYFKLSSVFKMNSPIDCHVVDRVGDKFRFNIIYNLQSFNNNTRMQIVTKTNDILPLVSLQGIYPAFNWSEREV